jgi:hypothetical protein
VVAERRPTSTAITKTLRGVGAAARPIATVPNNRPSMSASTYCEYATVTGEKAIARVPAKVPAGPTQQLRAHVTAINCRMPATTERTVIPAVAASAGSERVSIGIGIWR